MFNRFKEKLSGFKEALSSKIQEKVGAKLDKPDEALQLPTGPVQQTPAASDQSTVNRQTALQTAVLEAARNKNKAQELGQSKPKGRFSFLEKAKAMVFEQEIILDEKDLEEPLWALEMALLESDVALPVAEEIVKQVKSELVGAKKKIGADTGELG